MTLHLIQVQMKAHKNIVFIYVNLFVKQIVQGIVYLIVQYQINIVFQDIRKDIFINPIMNIIVPINDIMMMILLSKLMMIYYLLI